MSEWRSGMPTPAEQLRLLLETFRRTGAPVDSFDRCWAVARSRVVLPHETEPRRQWAAALDETRDEWKAAWHDSFTGTARAMSTMAEAA